MKTTSRTARALAPRFLVPITLAALLCGGCGGGSSTAVVNGDQVTVSGGQFEFHLTRREDFQDTYFLFGGMPLNHENAINQVTISGLPKDAACSIAEDYPDFHRCSSPGARLAQRATQQLDLIPASARVHDQLLEALDQFEESVQQGTDRTCVRLRGSILDLTKAVEPQTGTDILNDMPRELRHDYYLVEWVEIVGGEAMLAGL